MRKLAIGLGITFATGMLLGGCSGKGNDAVQGNRFIQPYFPSVSEGKVFFGGGDGRVHALDANTGEEAWATKVITKVGSSTNFSLAGGALIYRDARKDAVENSLTAVDPATGKEKWHTSENGVSFTVAAGDSVYYMGMDANSRTKLEIRKADSGETAKEVTLANDVVNGPALQGERLFFAGSRYNVYAYDLKSGEGLSFTIKDADPAGSGMPDTEPRATRDTIFLGSGQTVYAIDMKSGDTLWKHKKANAGDYDIILSGGMAIVNDGKDVVALDERTGAALWRYEAPEETSYPYAADKAVYVNSGNAMLALGLADGKQLWRAGTEGKVISLPAFAGGVLYFGDAEDRFYAVDAASGKELWRYKIER